jgi:hypothetical protein
MRAALFVGPHHIDVGDRPDAAIAGLSGVLAAKRIGAERIIALSRHDAPR